MSLSLIALMLAMIAVPAPALAQDDLVDCGVNVDAAGDWLVGFQSADGGFGNGFSPESDAGSTADAVVAIVRSGLDLETFRRDGVTPLDWLATQVQAGAKLNAGQLGKLLSAVVTAGADPSDFGGVDLVALTIEALGSAPDASGYLGMALAMLALNDAGAEIPPTSVEALFAARSEPGAIGFGPDQTPDTNSTALLAMVAAALDRVDVQTAALDYLKPLQNEDGGWPYQSPSDFGTESDANSTALVIQALVAAEVQLDAWNNPQESLAAYQLDDGSFMFQQSLPGPSFLATVAVLTAACDAAAWAVECVQCPIALPTHEVTATPSQ
jgi:prenyltransferase beta subunit